MVEQRQTPEAQKTPKCEVFARLENRWGQDIFPCVGLDSKFSQVPECIKTMPIDSIFWQMSSFNSQIVEATHDVACAYKINPAFYLRQNTAGIRAMKETIKNIHADSFETPVILDGKWADVEHTSLEYAETVFEEWRADAVTVNPYLGYDAVEPFLKYKDKGIFVVVKSSNPGGEHFQDLPLPFYHNDPVMDFLDDRVPETFEDGEAPFWAYVAASIALNWNKNGNCGIVVGATYPKELAIARKIVGDMPILIPGIGKQQADINTTVEAGMDSRSWGMILNSSRDVIFASSGEDFAKEAQRETWRLKEKINIARTLHFALRS